MADLNVNILSRFTKLPDRNQATVLVSYMDLTWKFFFYFPAFGCFETFNLQMNMLFSTFYKQFVGVKGVGKHRLARSMHGIHADFSVQM